jgi:pyruvate formate lyase activating enzyme
VTVPATASPLVRHPVLISPGEPTLEVAGVVQSSAVDGPGNRYVLFLQGCNFDCAACHNPTTIGRCDGCGTCVDRCPHQALSFTTADEVTYDAASCDHCRVCVTVCPIDADPTIRLAAVANVVDEIRPLAPFLSGITVTGGEPTLQLAALVGLFGAVKADDELGRLTTLVDTNGTLSRRGWEQLLPVLDGAMVDLKAMDGSLHRYLTGSGNDPVKESIHLLAERGKLAEVRLLVIEGVTDTDDELTAWARFVRSVDPQVPVRLMAFRHDGTRTAARRWPETSAAGMDRVRDRLAGLGLSAVAAG